MDINNKHNVKLINSYKLINIEKIILNNKEKNLNNLNYPVETISNKYGFINQEKYFNKKIASINKTNYYIARKNLVAFNPSRINVGSFAIKKDDDISLLSPLYINFYLNEKIIDKNYFLNFLESENFKNQMKKYSLISVRETLSFNEFKNIKIPLIDINKQKKIGEFLNNIDKKLSLNDKEIKIIEEYKRKIIKIIFFKKNNIYKKLNEVSYEKRSNIVLNNHLFQKKSESLFPLYGGGGNIEKYINFYEEENFIAISKDGSIGNLYYFLNKGSVIGTMSYIKEKNEYVDKKYLYYFLSTIDFKKYKKGSTIPHIYFKDWSKELIPIINFEKQKNIGNFLNNIDELLRIKNKNSFLLSEYKKNLFNSFFKINIW